MNRGRWALWSRGTKPDALTPWKEVTEELTNTYGVSPTFESLLAAFMLAKMAGVHIRMEWLPENAYGKVPASNGQALIDEAAKEGQAWGFPNGQEPIYV